MLVTNTTYQIILVFFFHFDFFPSLFQAQYPPYRPQMLPSSKPTLFLTVYFITSHLIHGLPMASVNINKQRSPCSYQRSYSMDRRPLWARAHTSFCAWNHLLLLSLVNSYSSSHLSDQRYFTNITAPNTLHWKSKLRTPAISLTEHQDLSLDTLLSEAIIYLSDYFLVSCLFNWTL